MWTSAVFVATALSLAPAQNDLKLELTNARATHGVLGPRRDPSKGMLPGDQLVICYDIEGMKTDEHGKVRYSVALDVIDKDGKVVFSQKPRVYETTVGLGGNSVPAFLKLDGGTEQPPGEYTLKVTVTDLATNQSKSMSNTGTLRAKDFGIVRMAMTYDPEGLFPAPHPCEGQSLCVHFAAVGFERAGPKGKEQPNFEVQMRILDKDGKPTTAKPFTGEVKGGVPGDVTIIPMQFLLELNRDGDFTVELKATDRISKKTTEASFPLTVLPAK
jgi:hypothetical protein